MFETAWIERISRIHPATPFVFWLPLIGWLMARAVRGRLGALEIAALVVAGAFLWTLVEYVLHRFVFHWVGARPWQRRVHFIIHGVHHDFPSDPDRLVMPLSLSIPLGAAFYVALRAALGAARAEPLFVGLVLGYLTYDGMHYAIHHFPMRSRLARGIKRHHMIHHHVGAESRWGVSSPLWDWVFGTIDEARPRARG